MEVMFGHVTQTSSESVHHVTMLLSLPVITCNEVLFDSTAIWLLSKYKDHNTALFITPNTAHFIAPNLALFVTPNTAHFITPNLALFVTLNAARFTPLIEIKHNFKTDLCSLQPCSVVMKRGTQAWNTTVNFTGQ